MLVEEREQLLVSEQLVLVRLAPHVMRGQIAEPVDHIILQIWIEKSRSLLETQLHEEHKRWIGLIIAPDAHAKFQ